MKEFLSFDYKNSYAKAQRNRAKTAKTAIFKTRFSHRIDNFRRVKWVPNERSGIDITSYIGLNCVLARAMSVFCFQKEPIFWKFSKMLNYTHNEQKPIQICKNEAKTTVT